MPCQVPLGGEQARRLTRTSRDNILRRPDHTAANMEAPTEMIIPDPAWVHDPPDAPILLNLGPGQPRFFNFRVQEKAIFDAMLGIVSRAMASRDA